MRVRRTRRLPTGRARTATLSSHDLDFTTILALGWCVGAECPSGSHQDVTSAHLEGSVVAALTEHANEIESGAIVVVDETRSRVRILPMRK